MDMKKRKDLIQKLESLLDSDIIVYFLSDRNGVPQTNIGEDAVRPLFEHLLTLKKDSPKQKLYLFLYSRGGAVEVPWRIVSMIRELYENFGIIIPYKAHSAATMIALGADEIVMGVKGELGPIDPSIGIKQGAEETVIQQQINVEDVMSYISFLKEKAGLSDQDALANAVVILANKLDPWLIGGMYRTKAHINLVARKLLTSHSEKQEEGKITSIIEALVEKTYYHGHALGRREAKELGLSITTPNSTQEENIWRLYETYEELFKLNNPIDARFLVEESQTDYTEDNVPIACIQSRVKYHEFVGRLKFTAVRQQPPQLNLNLNLTLQLPTSIQPEQINPEIANQFIGLIQSQLTEEVKKQVEQQSPIIGVNVSFGNSRWQEIQYPEEKTSEKIAKITDKKVRRQLR